MVRVNLSAINTHVHPEAPVRTKTRPSAVANVIINDVPELIKFLNTRLVLYTVGIIDPRSLYRQNVISILRVNESIDRGDRNKTRVLIRGGGGLALTALIIL